MNTIEFAKWASGWNVMKEQHAREKQMYVDAGLTEHEHGLPLDGGLGFTGRIVLRRCIDVTYLGFRECAIAAVAMAPIAIIDQVAQAFSTAKP